MVQVSLGDVMAEYPKGAPDAVDGRVACVVVNWNGAALTLACLEALAAQTWRTLSVVVVDNGSTDDSAERIEAWMEGRARFRLVRTGTNLGFAGGNNVGIRFAAKGGPEFVWLLNNDTVAPPKTLALLMAAMEPGAGMVGTVLRYAHDPARVQAWGGGHIDVETAFSTHFTAPHGFGTGDYLTFASVLLRTAMLRAIGLLDERFFMYFEDAEMGLRAERAGWGMAVAAGTAVLHWEGGSGAGEAPSQEKERRTTASGLLLIRLYARRPRLGMAMFLVRRLGKRLVQGRWGAARVVWETAMRGEVSTFMEEM